VIADAGAGMASRDLCGEWRAPLEAMALIGLGFRNFSMRRRRSARQGRSAVLDASAAASGIEAMLAASDHRLAARALQALAIPLRPL